MKDWVESAMRGERDAFERLVRRFRNMAYAVAYDRLHDAHLAEDAVQDAFAEVYVHLSKLEEPDAFPGWLKRIVARQCSRMLRRKRHRSVPYEQAAHVPAVQLSPHEIVEQRELRSFVRGRIADLPRHMRVAVWLFYIHGYSLGEISACLQTPVPVLKKRLFDARRKLKGTLPVADFVSVFRQLYEGGMRMLHIVNGDSVADKLKQGVVQGDILVWREIYSEGPAFADMFAPSARSVRADYLERAMGIPRQEYADGCRSQEQRLRQCDDDDVIVLWFEYDLFDQTMLSCLLHRLAQLPLARTKLNLLCIDSFPGIERFRGLGQLSVQQMETLSGTWQPVDRALLELGRKCWEAYASSDPRRIVQLLQEDTSALPFVRDAFLFHLSRYPSVRNGLGAVEQATLVHLSGGPERPIELFRQVGEQMHRFGMGDLQFWHILRTMAQGAQPLIRIEGEDVRLPTFSDPAPAFADCRISLTEAGRAVLDGAEDAVALNGIDRWLGGVHLQGKESAWRWDEAARTLVDRARRPL